MKAIGTTSGGGLLVEVNVSEARMLGEIAAALLPLAEPRPVETGTVHVLVGRVEAAAERPQLTAPRAKTAKSTGKAPAAGDQGKTSRDKTCVVCTSAFHDDTLRNKAVTCSSKCRRARVLQVAAARRLKMGCKPRAPKAAPAPAKKGEPLSREERLARIRAADAAARAKLDPLEQANRKAAELAVEEA